jgi:hypothetical protein
MKYRIQATIEASRLPEIVTVLYGSRELKFDPELKIYPATEVAVVPPQQIAARAKRSRARDGKRHEILEEALKTGPKRWSEMRDAMKAGGVSEYSLNSLIGMLRREGKIDRGPDGLWRPVVHEQSA